MSDDEDPDRSDPNDEYPLRPAGKTLADYQYSVFPLYREPELEEPPLQFTLAQLLWVMTFVAVGLSLLRCFPVDQSKLIAAAAGVTLLLSIIILEVAKPQDRRVYLVWWIGAGIYVLSSVTAMFRG
jgi:hypothetical protein